MLDRRKKMKRTMTRLIILLPVRPRTLLTQKARSLPMRSRPWTAKMLLLRRRNMCVNVVPIPTRLLYFCFFTSNVPSC